MKILPRLLLIATVTSAHAWTPSDQPPALPLKSFVLPEGLEITPWATSPALHNPTNFDFDHLGRMWVTEGVNYRKASERQPAGDRIVILEDTDGDGKSDKSSVFWQNPELLSPLGIAVFDNVVYVSLPPNLLKLTDVNRDSKFDPASGDTREVVLTGFNGKNHDHSLHSVTAGPDGKLYFNQGNTGAMFTDQSGKTFRIGSSYYKNGGGEWPINTKEISGKESDDGFVYVGGFAVRMNPDATNAEIVGHNFRNSYEQTVNSKGFVFQNDNDDPPACRTSHVMEYGNAGYFSNDGTRIFDADQRPGQPRAIAHWRQEDPGSMPAGDVYGGGSPTGIAYYENGALGEKFNGTLLSCEAARNVIFSYQPTHDGAGFKLDRKDFLTTNPEQQFDGADFTGGLKKHMHMDEADKTRYNFRPSDVGVGPDGAIYVADWTDPRVGGHDTLDDAASGVIYRIAPKGFKPSVPKFDLTTIEGAITALKSPAVNVRSLGYQKLKASGESAYDAVAKVLEESNPYIAARAIWLMPYLGEKGLKKLEELANSKDASHRLTAFRAIRRTDGKIDALPYSVKFSNDESPELRAEAALDMRSRPFEQSKEVLLNVGAKFDGKDRTYLESVGLGAGKNTAAFWKALEEKMKPGAPLEWSEAFAWLTWRMKPEAAVAALKTRAEAAAFTPEQRKFALDSIAFIKSKESAEALMALGAEGSPVKDQARWWAVNRAEGEWFSYDLLPELEKRGLVGKPPELVEIKLPEKPTSTKFTVEEVLALKGDAARGKLAAGRCIMCHKIDDAGPDYGPSIKGFGSRQPPQVVARSIVEPSYDISHGYEGAEFTLKDGKVIQGDVYADDNLVMVRSTGGMMQRFPTTKVESRKDMSQSLMLNADQMGMTAQDVADVVEWMKTY